MDSWLLAQMEDQEWTGGDAAADGQRRPGLWRESQTGGGLCEGDLPAAHCHPPARGQRSALRDPSWVLSDLPRAQTEILCLLFQGCQFVTAIPLDGVNNELSGREHHPGRGRGGDAGDVRTEVSHGGRDVPAGPRVRLGQRGSPHGSEVSCQQRLENDTGRGFTTGWCYSDVCLVTALSNSASQRVFIADTARRRGLTNLTVLTGINLRHTASPHPALLSSRRCFSLRKQRIQLQVWQNNFHRDVWAHEELRSSPPEDLHLAESWGEAVRSHLHTQVEAVPLPRWLDGEDVLHRGDDALPLPPPQLPGRPRAGRPVGSLRTTLCQDSQHLAQQNGPEHRNYQVVYFKFLTFLL